MSSVEKIVIISQGAGLSSYFQDCVNGFVYPAEDVNELYKRIVFAIVDHDSLVDMGHKARHLYDKYFSKTVAEAEIRKYIQKQGD